MTLADLKSTTMVARWRSLSADRQEAIGAKVLEWLFAELVAADDGTETSGADRDLASAMSERAFGEIDDLVEAAFPDVVWEYHGDVEYELRDRAGGVIGRITCDGVYQFVPTLPFQPSGDPKPSTAMPFDCVPTWAADMVTDGGWWGAVPLAVSLIQEAAE